ncbi:MULTISPECIES: hypothetical protein [unclassified Ruegeria]|uniref:hypothetical protein n=1 Tax=unclassified Ruegeria TaxID=2625375 RepID=UPI0014930A21|nr:MULTISPECIES: hypothetical protein [unclassified Ruegeria]NOD46271.1 hypothetical protein [Ruegeria sp. HKCCD5849]NOD50429.1 hypothetical protein [Ruegeria sp. HKCCD5851]NOD67245.1 hypothetical protein [Ruegeria sp. HKCCD7303]
MTSIRTSRVQEPKIDRLIVHFGMPKTGSKALQKIIRRNVSDDLAYPLSQGRWHRSIHDALLKMDDGPLLSSLEEVAGTRLAIISYENFSALPDEALKILSDRARTAANETWAMLFLRKQDEYAESLINQMWKAHKVSWEKANKVQSDLLEGKLSLDYEMILDRIGAGFNRVVPLVYDKSISSHISFSKAVGVKLDAPASLTSGRVNPALSAVELETMREVKRLAGNHEKLSDIVTATRRAFNSKAEDPNASSMIDGPATCLSDEQRETIMNRYASSNERVRERWFPNRAELFPNSNKLRDNSTERVRKRWFTNPAGLFSKSNANPDTTHAKPRLDVVSRVQREFDL